MKVLVYIGLAAAAAVAAADRIVSEEKEGTQSSPLSSSAHYNGCYC